MTKIKQLLSTIVNTFLHTYNANHNEFKGIKQVLAHPEKDLILQAQQKEIGFFIYIGVCTLVPFSSLPKCTDILNSHVVLKKKYTIDKTTLQKTIDKQEARLVIAGNKMPHPSLLLHHHGQPMHLALPFTCTNKWKVLSYDLSSAFCRTPLVGRVIFVRPPLGLAPPGHGRELHSTQGCCQDGGRLAAGPGFYDSFLNGNFRSDKLTKLGISKA